MQYSRPTTYARETGRRALVALVSLLWIIGPIICPAPLLAGGEAAESHAAAAPGEHHHHDHTTCNLLGHSNAATSHWTDQLQHDQYWPGGHFAPFADFATPPSVTHFDLFWSPSTGEEPPPQAWPRFTNSWSHAPPV